ncbi:hypothetical protein JYT44_00390 [Caldithrix abyssi]|nr:hypothetical protein [Caldithrix abyssi]
MATAKNSGMIPMRVRWNFRDEKELQKTVIRNRKRFRNPPGSFILLTDFEADYPQKGVTDLANKDKILIPD